MDFILFLHSATFVLPIWYLAETLFLKSCHPLSLSSHFSSPLLAPESFYPIPSYAILFYFHHMLFYSMIAIYFRISSFNKFSLSIHPLFPINDSLPLYSTQSPFILTSNPTFSYLLTYFILFVISFRVSSLLISDSFYSYLISEFLRVRTQNLIPLGPSCVQKWKPYSSLTYL